MNSTRIEELLKKYEMNELSDHESLEMEQAIEHGFIKIEELSDHQSLQTYINQSNRGPSTITDVKIMNMVQNDVERKVIQLNPKIIMGIAASLILLIISFWGGTQYSNSIQKSNKNLNQEVATLISATAVSEKIDLISSADLQNGANKQVINALFFTLNNDESNNVRLACIEALGEYILIPEVRKGLINSIRNQDSPTVIASLATSLNQAGAQIEKSDLMNMVRKDIPAPMVDALNIIY